MGECMITGRSCDNTELFCLLEKENNEFEGTNGEDRQR
jgi:hypothetical protein